MQFLPQISPARLRKNAELVLLVALLLVAVLTVYWSFLTFKNLFLFKGIGSDTINVFYPKYVHLANYVRTLGWPTWSFSQGMGQNIFGNGIDDPFIVPLLILGPHRLAYGLAYVEVVKILLAGSLFYLYLRQLRLEGLATVTGGLLYAFSGFVILGGTWYVFSIDAVYFALLLWSFERYLKDGSWIWFVIGIALVVADNSFKLLLYAVFFLPYSIFRHYDSFGFKPRELTRFLLKLCGWGMLGLGLSAVFLGADLRQMINSPRVLGKASYFHSLMEQPLWGFEGLEHNLTAVMRLFSDDLLGTGSDFRGWYNYLEAPMFYCGLLSLLLAPQVFLDLDRRRRISYAMFALVFLAPVVFPYFRHMFWAFSGDYYRMYSAFVAFVFLFFGIQALSRMLRSGEVGGVLLVGTLSVLISSLFLPALWGSSDIARAVDAGIRTKVIVFLLIYTGLVLVMKPRRSRSVAQWLLLLVVCVELIDFSWVTVNDRPVLTTAEYASKTGYNDYSNEAVAFLKRNDPGFYRIDKTYPSGPAINASINDAQVQGFFGTTSYNSFNQLNYIRFLDETGVIDGRNEAETRWAMGIVTDPLLSSLAAVKYVLVKRPGNMRALAQYGFRVIHESGNVLIMKNPGYLPFGFTYDRYLTMKKFLKLSKTTRRIAMMKAAVVEPPYGELDAAQVKPFDPAQIQASYSSRSFFQDVAARRAAVLQISEYDDKHITGRISLVRPQMLFFSLPFDAGWRVTVDDKPRVLSRVNVGFSGLVLPAGEHVVKLRYHVPYLGLSLLVSLSSLLVFILLFARGLKKPQR